MTYAGLTISDKPALLDAKARGFKTVKPFHQSANEWDVDIALAQIAEMESKQTEHYNRVGYTGVGISQTTSTPLTWNERINQMTAEEKAEYALTFDMCAAELRKPYGFCDDKYLYKTGMQHNGRFHDCRQCWIDKLNSPYTEGATK